MRRQESDPEKREGAVAGVVRDNTFMAELESRIVPAIVERDTFWRRYFYRLHLLQEAHRARTQVPPPPPPLSTTTAPRSIPEICMLSQAASSLHIQNAGQTHS